LFDLLGIKQNASTAFHPATDGQTERMNQDIEEYLRIFVNQQQDNWDEWLSIPEFCHNDGNIPRRSKHHSSLMLVSIHGRVPRFVARQTTNRQTLSLNECNVLGMMLNPLSIMLQNS